MWLIVIVIGLIALAVILTLKIKNNAKNSFFSCFFEKLWAITGTLFCILNLASMVMAWIYASHESPPAFGVSRSFAVYVCGYIAALIGMGFYVIDAILAIFKGINGERRIFNSILAGAVIVGVPILLLVASTLGTVQFLSWLVYDCFILILEAISLVLHFKDHWI